MVSRVVTVLGILAPLVALNALLLLLSVADYPNLPLLAVEALLFAALLSLLPRGPARSRLACLAGGLYALMLLLTAADLLVRQSLGRSLNLYLELDSVGPVVDLLQTNLGHLTTVLTLVALLALSIAVAALVAWLLSLTARRADHHGQKGTLLATALIATSLAFLPRAPISAPIAGEMLQQTSLALETRASAREFNNRLLLDDGNQYGLPGQPRPLPGLAGVDLLLGFIESYGISAFTDPRYSDLTGTTLDAMQQTLDAAGLHVVTGRLRSPVQGGQSWLGHTSLLSGQWVDTQLDYELLLASSYPTLIDDMRATGHETIAVMPAITRAWPEGNLYGYDRIHNAEGMDYQGPAFNWVTMPDQYTWHWFQQTVRQDRAQPVFAELALISSHAPWVPVLPVLENWDSIGSGEIFNRWKGQGEAPASLWKDPERVREHYGRSIAYSLEVAAGYAARHVDEDTLLVLLGDHQPASLITGENASRDVIVHIISGRRALLEPFVGREAADGSPLGLQGFRPGIRPEADTPGLRMDRFRPFLHRQFSTPPLLQADSAGPSD